MAEYDNPKQDAPETADTFDEFYSGPHRRSKDLPDRVVLHEKGSVRIQTIYAAVIALASAATLILLGTIQKEQALIESLLGTEGEGMELLRQLLRREEWLTGLLLLTVVVMSVSTAFLILLPMYEQISRIREHRMLPPRGSYELRYLAKAYNIMYEESRQRNEELRYKVEHDALTGLYNRGAYEKLLAAHGGEDIALLWVDVDKFKGVNDTYGHDVGDKILQKVARLLAHSFRSSDYACRTGGDEFAVIMTDMRPEQKEAVLDKLRSVREGLCDVSDGLPKVTLSIGAAFSAQRREGQDLFKMADTALYHTKQNGNDGCTFYEPEA